MNPSTAAMRPAAPLVQDIRPPAQPAAPGPRPVAPAIVNNIPVRQPGTPVPAAPSPQVIGNPIMDRRTDAVDNELDLILKDVSANVKASDQPAPKKGLLSKLGINLPTAGAQSTLPILLACAAAICLIAGSIMTFGNH